jgi:hypothetical protein
MKKTLLSSLIALTLVFAIIFFTRKQGPVTFGQQTPHVTLSSRTPEKSQLLDSAQNSPANDIKDKKENQPKKLDDLFFQTWLMQTPETNEGLWQARVRSTKALYEEVFKSLNINSSTKDKVMSIVLEREKNKLEFKQILYVEGFTKGGKKFAASLRSEEAIAEYQLRSLLGDKQYEILAQIERNHREIISIKAKEASKTKL